MNWITTSKFAKLAAISHQQAWRVIKNSPKESKKRDSRRWFIEKAYAQKWIEEKKQISIKPDEIAKIIHRSGPYVRKLLKNTKPDFAIHLTNGRWIIQDCPQYRDWIELQKIKGDQVRRKNLKSGKNSGIINYQGIMKEFSRWQLKVEGIDGPLKWPKYLQIRFLQDTIELARQRFHILKNLPFAEINDMNDYSLTQPEKNYYNELVNYNKQNNVSDINMSSVSD